MKSSCLYLDTSSSGKRLGLLYPLCTWSLGWNTTTTRACVGVEVVASVCPTWYILLYKEFKVLIIAGCIAIWPTRDRKDVIGPGCGPPHRVHIHQGVRLRTGPEIHRWRVQDGARALCYGKVGILKILRRRVLKVAKPLCSKICRVFGLGWRNYSLLCWSRCLV